MQIVQIEKECRKVFVRVDKVKTGLQAPYEGPYEVVRRFRKYDVIDVNGKNKSISIDRLKPAFETLDSPAIHPENVNR